MNKEGKPKGRWLRRAAGILVVLVILGWIGGLSEEEDAQTSQPAQTGQEQTSQTGQEPSGDTTGDEGGDTAGITPDNLSTGTSSDDEDAYLLQRMGMLEDIVIDVSTDEIDQINQTVAGMWSVYAASTTGKDPLVEERDWSKYTSTLGAENLSRREAAFYERLDKACLKYLSTSGLDAVKHKCTSGIYYATEGIKYSDLGLSKTQASSVFRWFRYNHPQYYFLAGLTFNDGSTLCPCMFEIMADAEDRAEITNELFDKLDGWIEQVKNGASTNYQREVLASNLLCVENNYEAQYEKPPESGLRYDQSLYSSVLLGKTVCAGYSMAFCAMMNAMDIDTTAGLSNGHAWNVVRADDGNYYAVDVCWNDTDSTPAYKNTYMNIGEEIMSATNSRKESHTYREDIAAWIPAIAKDSYVPTEEEISQFRVPQNLRVQESGATSVTLAWNEVADARLYQVAVFTDASRSEMKYRSYTKETSYTLRQMLPNTVYELGVCSRRTEDGKSVDSDWTYITVQTADGEPEKTTMLPTGIKITSSGEDTAYTTWSGVTWRAGYNNFAEVCQYTDASCTEMVEGYPKSADKYYNHTWTDLEVGKTYYFGVRGAKEGMVEIIYSDWVNFSYTHTGTT